MVAAICRNCYKSGCYVEVVPRHAWGLSLTRRIVEDIHHGKLQLVSSQPGETVIRMTLPGV